MINFSRFRIGIITASLLVAAMVLAPVAVAAPKGVSKSDLNKDGVVDYSDLVLFSSSYLEQDVTTIDWCAFVEATELEDPLYGRDPSYYTKNFSELLAFTYDYFGCGERSDVNADGRLNARDLMAFSELYAGVHFLLVDWCVFLESVLNGEDQYGQPASYYLNNYGALILYIQDEYSCGAEPPVSALSLKNNPKFLTRMAVSRNLSGDYYVTDPKVGSVFIYDSNLVLSKEIKDLKKPLGIGVNSAGHILVGSDKKNNVEVYNPENGTLLTSFGETEIETPSSIMVDSADNVYVTDSGSNTIYVYDSSYQLIKNIGEPGKDPHQLRGPSNAILSADETELFVLDRLNQRIQVFDLDGEWLRSITFEGTEGENCNWFTGVCETPGAPAFTRIQAMDFDATGRLHVLDMFHAVVSIFDPVSGEFLGGYGDYGLESGQLKSPGSLLVEGAQALIADGGKNTIEVLVVP
jgi:hypothetical protein